MNQNIAREEGEDHASAALSQALSRFFIYMKAVRLDNPRARGGAEAGGAQMPLSAGPTAR